MLIWPVNSVLGSGEPRLRGLLAEGSRLARRHGRPVLVSLSLNVPSGDPLTFFQRSLGVIGDRVFWSRPSAERTLAGAGTAWTYSANGPRRFEQAAEAWRALCSGALVDSATNAAQAGPTALAGFSFAPFRAEGVLWDEYPDALLILPRYTLTSTDRDNWFTVNVVVSPEPRELREAEDILREGRRLFDESVISSSTTIASIASDFGDEDPRLADDWKSIVSSVVARIRRGEVEKVVLARARRIQSQQRFRPARVLGRLRASYPNCFLFAVERGYSCFLGASPEQLISLRNGRVGTVCLAGSTARGETHQADRHLGEELLASRKNRSEHAIVVRGIAHALTDMGVQLDPIGEPSLVKVSNIQHLFTPIGGRVGESRTIFDFLARLHPTPSVGGSPRDTALAVIRECEGLDRGWYTGAVGWIDAAGQGEFAVAIRSALLRGSEAVAFAGCGIVADSDPEQEYAESCLKLRPMLSALRQGGD